MPNPISRARHLRRHQTEAEALLWNAIKNNQLGAKFRRQVPVGSYIVDFACLDLKLVVEVDGSQHAESAADVVRTQFLNSLGFKVIRFWNNEVVQNIEGVAAALTEVISQWRDR